MTRFVQSMFVTIPVTNLEHIDSMPNENGSMDACSLSMPQNAALGTAYMCIAHNVDRDSPRLSSSRMKLADFHRERSNDFKARLMDDEGLLQQEVPPFSVPVWGSSAKGDFLVRGGSAFLSGFGSEFWDVDDVALIGAGRIAAAHTRPCIETAADNSIAPRQA